jgi:cytochrome c biogenesis protein ResB
MENSERAFKRELLTARRLIEEAAEQKKRPSREVSTSISATAAVLSCLGLLIPHMGILI